MTILGCIAPVLLAALPAGSQPTLHLLEPDVLHLDGLSIPAPAPPAMGDLLPSSSATSRRVASSTEGDDEAGPSSGSRAGKPQQPAPGAGQPESLEFNLLGPAPQTARVDEHELQLRRTLLTWHQGVGLGMYALQIATTVVGQLNYLDKFGGANTGKYVDAHSLLAFSTLAAFVATGSLALLAPNPLERHEGFDRVALHKLAMFTAAGGMLAQGILGVWAQSREGYLNQQSIATAHLVVGYVTFALVTTGIAALVY